MGLLKRSAAAVLALTLSALPAAPARALETDQFYAWGRPLEDSSEALNAKINAEIGRALAQVNARDAGRGTECRAVIDAIKSRYVMFIFQDIELWAARTPLLHRIPATPDEEFTYRKDWIYRDVAWFDLGRAVPPSPTIEVAGVSFGTDKLSHFFSEGIWYFRWYEAARAAGKPRAEAEEIAIRRGVLLETTVLGGVISGVMSPADLEANYQGLQFYLGLCEGDSPGLVRTASGWTLREPFDFRPYITPEWDESYSPSVVTPARWAKVRPAIAEHCAMLSDPSVRARRARYAARDRETPTEKIVHELVSKGQLPDPADYGVERICASERQQRADLAPSALGSSK